LFTVDLLKIQSSLVGLLSIGTTAWLSHQQINMNQQRLNLFAFVASVIEGSNFI